MLLTLKLTKPFSGGALIRFCCGLPRSVVAQMALLAANSDLCPPAPVLYQVDAFRSASVIGIPAFVALILGARRRAQISPSIVKTIAVPMIALFIRLQRAPQYARQNNTMQEYIITTPLQAYRAGGITPQWVPKILSEIRIFGRNDTSHVPGKRNTDTIRCNLYRQARMTSSMPAPKLAGPPLYSALAWVSTFRQRGDLAAAALTKMWWIFWDGRWGNRNVMARNIAQRLPFNDATLPYSLSRDRRGLTATAFAKLGSFLYTVHAESSNPASRPRPGRLHPRQGIFVPNYTTIQACLRPIGGV